MDQNGSYVSVTPVTMIKWALLVSQFQSHHARPCLVSTLKFFFTKKRMYAWSTEKKLFVKPFHG